MNDTDRAFCCHCMYFMAVGDPERFTDWDQDRFKALLPVVWDAWERKTLADRTLAIVIRDAERQCE